MLAARGAHVVLAVRDIDKGKEAAPKIRAAAPRADVTVQPLDLGSLQSVRTAAEELKSAYPRIDLLINNAGVMYPPKQTTTDGFELQFGTNHLGHFALTGLLLENLLPVEGSRVVTVASIAHRIQAAIHFDDLQWERSYNRVAAYGQSKLANLMFTYELNRRLGRQEHPSRWPRTPGVSNTELMRHIPGSGSARLRHPGGLVTNRRRWARWPRCAPPPTRQCAAGSTTAPTASAHTAWSGTRSWSSRAASPTIRPSRSGCGRCPRNSPASLPGLTDAFRRGAPGRRRRSDPAPRPPSTLPPATRSAWSWPPTSWPPLSLPGFDNSAMDGYAVLAEDIAGATEDAPVKLPVAEDIPAGRTDTLTLEPGTAHRIMTGAPLPAGRDGGGSGRGHRRRLHRAPCAIRASAPQGQHVRRAGEDVTAGTTVLRAGQVLTPPRWDWPPRSASAEVERRSAATGSGDVDGLGTGGARHPAAARPDLRVQRRDAGRRGPRRGRRRRHRRR